MTYILRDVMEIVAVNVNSVMLNWTRYKSIHATDYVPLELRINQVYKQSEYC